MFRSNVQLFNDELKETRTKLRSCEAIEIEMHSFIEIFIIAQLGDWSSIYTRFLYIFKLQSANWFL
jgi:hypothetical protein